VADADWTNLNDGLDANTVRHGAIGGQVVPAGGGDFVYGFNSLIAATGAAGRFYNGAGFAPNGFGMSVRGAVKKLASGGVTGWSPFLFACAQGPSVNDVAYCLGLEDDDPHRIVLRKGPIVAGIPSDDDASVLRASDATFTIGDWVHLRLDAHVNENGDVVLAVQSNDLSVNDVDAPVWADVPGMAVYVDDAIGIASGSLPYTSGRAGFGVQVSDVTRRSLFDQVQIIRQTGFA